MKYRKRFATLLLIALVIGVLAHQESLHGGMRRLERSQPGLYGINHFIDGDTIAVNMGGAVEAVRFIGVDTPETHKPNSPVQCYGMIAAAFTKQQIGTGKVRLEADPLDTNRDRYNRLLRYVYLQNGQLLNQLLITGGYGFAYTQFPFDKAASFTLAQNQAQVANKGLWGSCQPYQESGGRWQTENAIAPP